MTASRVYLKLTSLAQQTVERSDIQLAALCACDILSRDELMSYFKSLFQKLRRTPDGIWSWLANSCADLCPEEVLEELGQAYEEGLPDPGVIGWGERE